MGPARSSGDRRALLLASAADHLSPGSASVSACRTGAYSFHADSGAPYQKRNLVVSRTAALYGSPTSSWFPGHQLSAGSSRRCFPFSINGFHASLIRPRYIIGSFSNFGRQPAQQNWTSRFATTRCTGSPIEPSLLCSSTAHVSSG